MAILLSSHHESLKAQKAINGLFVKYNIQFYRVFKSFFRISDKDNHTCGLGFSDLVSQIGSMSFDSTGLYWRPLFEEFEKSTSSDKDTCNFGFEYTLKEITVQAVT
ncbi:proteasome activator subunit 4-like [Arachis hypogaea]|nr:Proteasome activator subunit [Arachis hypogaea]